MPQDDADEGVRDIILLVKEKSSRAGDRGWIHLLVVLLGTMAAANVVLAVLEVNRLPLVARDTVVLFLGAVVLVGIPVGAGFSLLHLFISRTSWAGDRNAAARLVAALLVVGILVVGAGRWFFGAVTANAWLHWPILVLLASFLALDRTSLSHRRTVFVVTAAAIPFATVALAAARGSLLLREAQPVIEEVRPTTPPHSGRILLIGVDGLCWETLKRWRLEQDSEDLRWFDERASLAPLSSIAPADSPRIWTSIATGLEPEEHGILGFTAWEFSGVQRPLVEIPRLTGAFFWLSLTDRLGIAHQRPVSSLDVRRPPFWDIVGTAERPIDVVGWWATWPALPLNGRLVSDKFYFWRDRRKEEAAHPERAERERAVMFPPDMAGFLTPLRMPPGQMTAEQIRTFIDISPEEAEALIRQPYRHHDVLSELPLAFTMDETYYRVAHELLARVSQDAIHVFYFRGPDIISHSAMQYSSLYPEAPQPPETRARYGKLLSTYYAYTFSHLRRLVEAAGEGAVVLVVSDHGFERMADGEYNHPDAPDGVIMSMGAGRGSLDPESRPGVMDVAPTMLWLAGYPVAEDMPGRPLRELFPQAGADTPALARCPSYGPRRVSFPANTGGPMQGDEEMLELLRTLGYIN